MVPTPCKCAVAEGQCNWACVVDTEKWEILYLN